MSERIVMTRLTRRGEDDGSFDREFWHRVGPEARFATMWEMVAEVDLIRGKDGHQPRLHRSVHRIERRGS